MNALLGGGKNSGHSGSGQSSSPLGNLGGLASQFLGGGLGGSEGGGSGGGKNSAGKLVGQLASSFMSSAHSQSEKPPAPQNYHGGSSSSSHQQQGGIAGTVMGGVASMFGGKHSSSGVSGTLNMCIFV